MQVEGIFHRLTATEVLPNFPKLKVSHGNGAGEVLLFGNSDGAESAVNPRLSSARASTGSDAEATAIQALCHTAAAWGDTASMQEKICSLSRDGKH